MPYVWLSYICKKRYDSAQQKYDSAPKKYESIHMFFPDDARVECRAFVSERILAKPLDFSWVSLGKRKTRQRTSMEWRDQIISVVEVGVEGYVVLPRIVVRLILMIMLNQRSVSLLFPFRVTRKWKELSTSSSDDCPLSLTRPSGNTCGRSR